MKIKEITEEKIVFDNGTEISFYHERQCYEHVYADFKQLKDSGVTSFLRAECDFPEDLQVEMVKNAGFRFGGKNQWFFVPCYNVQNGYYSDDLDIIITYPDKTVKKINVNDGLQHFID